MTYVPRLTLLGTLGIVVGLVLLIQGPAVAQQNVPQDKMKEEFFSRLDRPEIVQLMRSIDRGKQFTSFELGAKYRWGYIPPDRRPPVRLAQWWEGLSARQKDQERYEWFQKHYQQLNLSRAARELGLQDRLTEIYRELRQELNKPAGNLETVPFPGDTVNPPEKSGSDTGFQPIYRQSPSGSDQPVPNSSANADVNTPNSESTTNSGGASNHHGKQASSKSDTPQPEANRNKTVSSTRSDTGSFDDGSVIYRRIGDHIEIIGGQIPGAGTTETADTTGRTMMSSETDHDSPASAASPPTEPRLNRTLRSNSSSGVVIPFPELRHLLADPPKLRR
jgi:hypothetical protein